MAPSKPDDRKKHICAHPGCTCPVHDKWTYCSPACASGTSNATCNCGHAACKGASVGR